MINQRDTNVSASDLLRALFRQSKKAFLVFCLVVLATVGWIVFAPRNINRLPKFMFELVEKTTHSIRRQRPAKR